MQVFDHVIVGGGSAGCVLAERLSADGTARVLLLEAGGSDARLGIRVPIGYGRCFDDARVNWCFEAEADGALGGRRLYWPRGRVIGGSGSINGLVWCRGLPRDFDDWEAAGNPGWGAAEAARVFASIERRLMADGRADGAGTMAVADREPDCHPLRRHFFAAAEETGLGAPADLAAPSGEAVGLWRMTTHRGLRCSAADAFLKPARRRPNLSVRTGVRVRRVLFEGRRATGVEIAGAEGPERIAAREVILSAGAVQTPQILQHSGVGPGALLQSLGIPVVHANACVGGGLQDHLGVDYMFRAVEPTLNQTLGTLRGRVGAAWLYLAARRGPLSLSVNQAGGLVASRPGLPHPDLQLYFNPLSYTRVETRRRRLMRPDPWPGFAFGFNACRPTSRGRIDIADPDPTAPPRILPNYLATEHDVAEALAGCRLVQRLMGTRALTALVEAALGFDPRGAAEDALLSDFRARASTVFHPCSTARMAPEGDGGVLDPRCRVHGLAGLRVVDASAFPGITSANTNAPTMMLAARAAELIVADRRTA